MKHNIFLRLMEIQTQFPTMRWDFNDFGGITVDITCLEPHEIEALRQAREMFAPVERCEFTHAHTREFCGNSRCRPS